MFTIYSVIYVSTAVQIFTPEQLTALLTSSRERNYRCGISGLLLHKDGCFIQAIEGEKQVVKTLHQKIAHDSRHRNLVVLAEGPITQRAFPDWTMGFRELGEDDFRGPPKLQRMLSAMVRHDPFSIQPALAKKLLLGFSPVGTTLRSQPAISTAES